jgi:hypothetical protein
MLLTESTTAVKFSFISLALIVSPVAKSCGTAAGTMLIANAGVAAASKRNAVEKVSFFMSNYSQVVLPKVAVSKEAGFGASSPPDKLQADSIGTPRTASNSKRR